MSPFKAPQGVLDTLEKIIRNFLWGGCELKNRMHWVHWSKINASIVDGGFGVSTLKVQNLALLVKWSWRLMNEKWSLWKKNSLAYIT